MSAIPETADQLRASLQRSMEQAARGELLDAGSFAEYADDDFED